MLDTLENDDIMRRKVSDTMRISLQIKKDYRKWSSHAIVYIATAYQ